MNAHSSIPPFGGGKASARGYQVLFHADTINHCPGCHGVNWLVGRITAECARCGTALPLAEAASMGLDPVGHKQVALHLVAGGKPYRERRSDKRQPADGCVLTLHIDGAPRAFAIEDISAGGLKGEAIEEVFSSKEMLVELEDGSVHPVEVRWRTGGFIGLAFINPGQR
ncbi:PilZ domain-containing protein [Novosphingobium sp.]|uniref:PilZ domain-containing protein n=1 Tax=Novosphingobium sp. TaxID=1874826 RepID=UPI0025F9665A|nr:PilZ domain-containing protein [Novosphingobium sp.]